MKEKNENKQKKKTKKSKNSQTQWKNSQLREREKISHIAETLIDETREEMKREVEKEGELIDTFGVFCLGWLYSLFTFSIVNEVGFEIII